jgi:dipeptidyl aminopeptidase/acylaminoacyl peptidase
VKRGLFLCLCILVLHVLAYGQSLPAPNAITDPAKLESVSKLGFQQIALEKFFMTRALEGASWSPDGKQVAFSTNISGRLNIWTIPAGGGWPTQLSISDQRQISPLWSPDGKWIAVLSDYDGDEMWDIFLISPQTGDTVNFTLSRNIQEMDPAWSPDSKRLAYTVRPKEKAAAEIDATDLLTKSTVHVTRNTPEDRSNAAPIWSKDGTRLAWTVNYANEKRSDVCMADLSPLKTECLTSNTGDQKYSAVAWSPDGTSILITSNAANGFDNVALLDVTTRKIDWITQDKWEMSAGGFSPDGKRVVYSANVDGETGLYAYDLATKQTTRLDAGGGVNSVSEFPVPFSPDGSHLLYVHDSATQPRSLWSYDLETGKSTQLTKALMGGVHPEQLVEPQLVHFSSKDGKYTISAQVYMPYSLTRNGKFPAIVYVHGGPADQSKPDFVPLLQYFANQGYIIIAPNYRGSSGYGKDFQDADRMDAGGAELQDVVDAAEFIKKSGYVDPKKLIIMGRSYGGYLTMMGVTKFPDLWAAGVPIVPFVNWFTEYQNEDATLQASDREFMGDPVKNKELWTDRSPFFFLDKVKAPLSILAGGNDPRCPKTESQQVADTIRKRGGIAQLKIYENEGHAFSRIENILDAYRRVSDFLKTYVPSPGCGCTVFE